MRNESRWPLVVIGSALVLGALLAFDFSGPVRVVAALWFLLACPGMAFIPLLGVRLEFPLGLALIPVVSVVLDTLVATALTLAGVLSETSAVLALAGVSIFGCGLQLLSPTAPQVAEAREGLGGQPATRAGEPVPGGQG